MLKYYIKKYLLIFIVLSTYTSAQQTSIPIQIEQVPVNILNDLKQFFGIDYSIYVQYEDYSGYKFFKVGDKYLIWLAHGATASNYTALAYADSVKILSFKEYFDRTPFSLIINNKYVQVNYNYGCCDGRYQIATFYNSNSSNLTELATVLLGVDKIFYHDNKDKYEFTLSSKHDLIIEPDSNYNKITIKSEYAVTKMTLEEYKKHDLPIKSPQKFYVNLIYYDGFFNAVQTEDKYLADLLECFYCYERTCSENCYELYSKENRYTSHWKEEWVKVIDPFLMFIARLELK